MRRARPLLGLVLLLAACGPPEDRAPLRPTAVPPTPFEQKDLLLGTLRLRYIDVRPESEATATLPVVMIPGHTSRIEEYDAMVPVLARRHRVLVLDFPGSGYSSKPERDYDLRFYEDTLVDFLDALGVGQAFLVGGSQGGNLTLRLGWRFPERFPRLCPWAPGSAWPARPWLARLMRAVGGYTLFWPTVRIQSTYWYDEDWPGREHALRETFAYYDEVMGPGFVRMYWGMAADQMGRSLFPLVPEIEQPTLLAWGDQDHGASMGEGVARLHELLPHSELLVVPGARHSLAAEVPVPLAEAILGFLSRPAGELP